MLLTFWLTNIETVARRHKEEKKNRNAHDISSKKIHFHKISRRESFGVIFRQRRLIR